MASEPMSQEVIQGLAHKLEELGATLPPREKALLCAILMGAGGEPTDDVEGHGVARMSIAALVLAAAGTVGVTHADSGSAHHVVPAVTQVHHVVSVVNEDKGGSETITYTTAGRSSSP